MSSSGPGSAVALSASRHAVKLYAVERELLQAVRAFADEGLAAGDAVLLALTPRHEAALAIEGTEHVRVVSAPRLLAEILPDLHTDGASFHRVLHREIEQTPGRNGRVRIFGELVDLLAAERRFASAARLERLYSEWVADRPCSLLCAYALSRFPIASSADFLT